MTQVLSRRTLLKGAGVAIALPWLDAMAQATPRMPRRRLVCVDYTLSLYTPDFFPVQAGRGYQPSVYLEVLKEFRDHFTVFSGLANPGMEASGGHGAMGSFLSGAPGIGAAGFRNSISMDQMVAEKVGVQTRFPSVVLSPGLSIGRNGVSLPGRGGSPSKLFAQFFLEGTPKEVELQVRRLREGRSILDVVRAPAKTLEGSVGPQDRDKLDEYFSALREVEQRLQSAEDWAKKPKPKVDVAPFKDVPENRSITMRLQYDLMHLAFKTDSTRVFTMAFDHPALPPLPGVTYDHHNLSHHGNDPDKLRQLRVVESDKMQALRDFLAKLKGTREEDETLLDRTLVLVGSHMGAGNHTVDNLPILLAGGRFKHGQHLAFDRKHNLPLCNLYVMMLRHLGVPVDSFGSSTGTVPGLEVA
jgi:hypothetical protein